MELWNFIRVHNVLYFIHWFIFFIQKPGIIPVWPPCGMTKRHVEETRRNLVSFRPSSLLIRQERKVISEIVQFSLESFPLKRVSYEK